MAIKFHVSADLQAMIAGFGSKTVANFIINRGFTTTPTNVLPIPPDGKRYALVYDKLYSGEYNVTLANLDGSSPFEIVLPR